MEWAVGRARIELGQGDITLAEVDAVVNAANSRLAGGGGVDGAIHRRGGPAIMAETARRYPEGCPTGSAVITTGGLLAARYVIHAVGPVWHGGSAGEPGLLAGAHRRALELAAEHDCRTLAFPALSTGAYGYPLAEAAPVALRACAAFLARESSLEAVRFVLFDEPALAAFAAALARLIDSDFPAFESE